MIKEEIHLGIYGIIRKDNDILLVNKTRGPYTGKLDLPGGSIKHGEDLFHALSRELNEELNLNLNKDNFIHWDNVSSTYVYHKDKKKISFYHIGMIYLVKNLDINKIDLKIVDEDINGAQWVPIDKTLNNCSTFVQYVTSILKVEV